MNILFVCASNVCRSPYCEFMFRRMVEQEPELNDKVHVTSSAVFNQMKKMDPKTRKSLRREGFTDEELDRFTPSIWFRSIQKFKDADIIIGMTRLQKLLTPLPFQKKYVTLSEAATGTYHTIPDPYLIFDQDEYNAKMDTIKGYLEQYLNRLKQEIR